MNRLLPKVEVGGVEMVAQENLASSLLSSVRSVKKQRAGATLFVVAEIRNNRTRMIVISLELIPIDDIQRRRTINL